MSGNTYGRLFTVTTFGESHGPALGCIVDGCPPGLLLDEDDIQRDVERRRSGTSKYTSQRREPDRVRILSGVFEGRTTGTPIGLLVENEDQRSYDLIHRISEISLVENSLAINFIISISRLVRCRIVSGRA